jgi:NADH dehydrogenase
VVVGGGFGGLRTARDLKHVPVDVVVVDKSNHHVFQPLLYQVASAALSPADIAAPIRRIFRRQDNVRAPSKRWTSIAALSGPRSGNPPTTTSSLPLG